MIYMADSSYVAMRFVAAEYFLLRIESLAGKSWKKQLTIQLTTLLKNTSCVIKELTFCNSDNMRTIFVLTIKIINC